MINIFSKCAELWQVRAGNELKMWTSTATLYPLNSYHEDENIDQNATAYIQSAISEPFIFFLVPLKTPCL